MCLDDPSFDHVDEVPSQHVRRQQHLACSTLEGLGADGVCVEAHAARFQGFDQILAYEDVLRAHADLQPGDRRICTVGELDDEVFDAAHLSTGRVEHGTAQQLRHHQAAPVADVPRFVHAPVAHSAIIHLLAEPHGLRHHRGVG